MSEVTKIHVKKSLILICRCLKELKSRYVRSADKQIYNNYNETKGNRRKKEVGGK